MLACAAWYVVLVGFHFLPGMSDHNTIFMIIATISAVAMTGVMMGLGANRSGALQLFPDRIVLGTRALDRRGLRADLAVWKQANLWTTLGSAIHLQTPSGSLWIGGRDRLLVLRGDRPSTQKVDASLSSDDFMEFVRSLELFTDPLAGTEVADALVIDLLPSTASRHGLWHAMSPWIATMALAAAIGILAGSIQQLQAGVGLVIVQAATVIVVVGGIVVTMRRNMRPPKSRWQLRVDPMRVALFDLRRGSFVDGAVPHPPATRLIYRYSTRGGTFEFPALRLVWPSKVLVLAVWDTTIHWSTPTERCRKLDYLVGPEEWRRLVDALRLE